MAGIEIGGVTVNGGDGSLSLSWGWNLNLKMSCGASGVRIRVLFRSLRGNEIGHGRGRRLSLGGVC
jgi:hypothetical protein